MATEASQSCTVEVAAPIERCFATITDFGSYPEWNSSIIEARVLSSDAAGRAREVEFLLDARIRKIRYVLAYEHDPPLRLTWRLARGDLREVSGEYRFEPLGPERTRATCTQRVTLTFWVPGPLRRMMERQALRDAVDEFRREAERRAR